MNRPERPLDQFVLLSAVALLPLLGASDVQAAKLTVRVTDAQTGKILPARLSLRASDGSYPGDRLRLTAGEWPGLEGHALFTPGQHTFDLPPGATSVTAAHGPQYATASKTIELLADRPVTVELKLQRLIDLRQLGWVGGDAHLHMMHGEMQRPT